VLQADLLSFQGRQAAAGFGDWSHGGPREGNVRGLQPRDQVIHI
jgi:hypothetical protein